MTGLPPSCGACKFLRRKCTDRCIFAPYFCAEQGVHQFAAVHKVFGASNVSKLLSQLPVQHRYEAAITISYEAVARMRDPVYGCTAHIIALQKQVANLQEEIEVMESLVANFINGLGHASSQTTNENHNQLPICPQVDAIDRKYSLQQPHQPLHSPHITANMLPASETNPQYLAYTPGHQYSFGNSIDEPNSNALERLYMEMEGEILPGGFYTQNMAYYLSHLKY